MGMNLDILDILLYKCIIILFMCYITTFLALKKHSLAFLSVIILVIMMILSYILVLPNSSEKVIEIIHNNL
jgi:tryptophan-rich sensory protein